MFGGSFRITRQKQYKDTSGNLPGYDKFAEDKKENRKEMFSLMSCAFFCCLK